MRTDKQATKTNLKTFLVFWVDQQLFAANVNAVLEVLRNEQVSPIPRHYDFIEGIINFRGEVVTVVNTGKKLLMPNSQETDKNVIIVFEFTKDQQSVKLGAMADQVMNVREVPASEVHAVPDFGENYNPEFLEGTLKTDDGFALILKIEKIFSEREIDLIQESNDTHTTENT